MEFIIRIRVNISSNKEIMHELFKIMFQENKKHQNIKELHPEVLFRKVNKKTGYHTFAAKISVH